MIEPNTIRVGIERSVGCDHMRGCDNLLSARKDLGLYVLRDIKPVDGDTVKATIEVAFIESILLVTSQTIRIAGPDINVPFDAWELHGEEKAKGLLAKAALLELLESSSRFVFKCYGREKYGRYLGAIFADGVDVATYMREKGHART